jgi:hypothetical protein
MPRAQIKDERTYRALRRAGNSEEKSARIANAAAASSRREVGRRGRITATDIIRDPDKLTSVSGCRDELGYSGAWHTASTLLPSGSRTNAP